MPKLPIQRHNKDNKNKTLTHFFKPVGVSTNSKTNVRLFQTPKSYYSQILEEKNEEILQNRAETIEDIDNSGETLVENGDDPFDGDLVPMDGTCNNEKCHVEVIFNLVFFVLYIGMNVFFCLHSVLNLSKISILCL